MGSRIIGIDLGTTSSLVAVMDGSKPKLIPDHQGRTVMPSLVVIKQDGSILVGHEADTEAKKYSDKTLLVASMKRSMGQNKEYGWHDSKVPVQLIAAMVLAELKIRAETHLGESVEKAVIAVPANFNFKQRQHTKEAALIAGLEPIRIVNEATASMCAFQDLHEGNVVTADLGGGTFDVSAIDFGEGVFQVVSTEGDDQLGGDDFTAYVLKLIFAKTESKFDPEYLQKDPVTSKRLVDAAEDVKKQLTSMEIAEVNIPYVQTRSGTFEPLSCTLTRKQFDTICEPLYERIDKLVDKVCAQSGFWKEQPRIQVVPAPTPKPAKKSWLGQIFPGKNKPQQNIQNSSLRSETTPPAFTPVIWLIGNASRVPEIRRRLHYKNRAWHPPGILDLKEPVALGAAIIAGVLEGMSKETLLIDVTPNTLGIELEGGVASPMIPRNTRIPATHTHTFTTVSDNQTSITVRILEGDRPLSRDNRILGTLRIDNLPPAKKGIPQIELRFDVDASNLLRVTATDLGTKKTSELKCSELGLSDQRLNQLHQQVQKWIRDKKRETHFEPNIEAASTFTYSSNTLERCIEKVEFLLLKRSLARNELQQINEICSRLLVKAMGDDDVVMRLVGLEFSKAKEIVEAFRKAETSWNEDYRRY